MASDLTLISSEIVSLVKWVVIYGANALPLPHVVSFMTVHVLFVIFSFVCLLVQYNKPV